MSNLSSIRHMIQTEETAPSAAVSEATMSRVGEATNFINERHMPPHDFNLNGVYNGFTGTLEIGDGVITYPFAFEIYDVILATGSAVGSGGTTEIDLKWAAEGSSTFVSIFTTTPKFTNAAAVKTITYISAGAKAGFTKPVLSKSTFAAYDRIYCTALQAVTGTPNGAFLKVFIRAI